MFNMKRTKKFLSLTLAAALAAGMSLPALAAEETAPVFTDVASDAWYAPAVTYVAEKGIMNGTGGDAFSPDLTVTRGMVYQTLYNLAGRPAVTEAASFNDVSGQWYADAAAWAEDEGLTSGVGQGAFGGQRDMTRQELGKVFADYAKAQGAEVANANLSTYADAASVADWAKDGMERAVALGILSGSQNKLNPTGTAQRSELAQMLMNFSQISFDSATVTGSVAAVEKYGNLDLDIKPQALYDAGFELGDVLRVTVKGRSLEIPFCTAYSDVNTGENVVRDNQESDILVVAINMGNFAETYGVTVGDTVTFSLAEKAGYLGQYQAHQLTRTNERSDYASDEVFANFRAITVGDIAEGVLYRTSSPVNPELGRASYADNLIEKAGVKTVVNLADDAEAIQGYFAAEGFDSPYYKGLYEAGNVIALNMGVDYKAADFQAKLKTGLEFMISHEGPYAFHCTEGKDRAGFTAILLEALMGASQEEIVADYMVSYENYYHVEKGSEQYKLISEVAVGMLRDLAGLEKGADLSGVDLQQAAQDYLTGIGLTADQISALKTNLSTPVAG